MPKFGTALFSRVGPFRDGDLSNFSVGDANARYIACMRGINVAAVAGIAVATVLTAPAVLVGASSAHADTGVDGYVSCVGGDAKPPPPEVSAVNWFPSLYVIDTDIASGVPADQVVQRLIVMGVQPNDAATRVRCYLANLPH